MKPYNVTLVAIAVAITALGCSSSSEPTESEIAKVIQYQVNHNEFVDADVKANYATLKVKKISCKAQNDQTGLTVTRCTIELTTERPFVSSGMNTITDTIAMTKAKDGWVVYGGMYMIK